MKHKKILFSDLDGTLLNDKKEIEGHTAAAIERLLAQGHYFAICTGRPLASACAVAARFGLDREGCYIIAYNGGTIYDPVRGTELYHATIPLALVQQLFSRAQEAGLYIHTYDKDDTIVTYADAPELSFYTKHTRLVTKTGAQMVAQLTQNPPKAIVASLTDHEALVRFQQENASWTKDAMNSFFSCEQYLEYCPYGVSKGDAVKRLCAQLGIPVAHSFAAGDERNDIAMLKAAGCAAVPSNAHPDARSVADVICEKDNNGGAVGELIERYMLQ